MIHRIVFAILVLLASIVVVPVLIIRFLVWIITEPTSLSQLVSLNEAFKAMRNPLPSNVVSIDDLA